jgi:hypothetical protein
MQIDVISLRACIACELRLLAAGDEVLFMCGTHERSSVLCTCERPSAGDSLMEAEEEGPMAGEIRRYGRGVVGVELV